MANEFTDFDWIKGFGLSALEGIPETVGITPSTETTAWRQDHPVSGLVSEFAGLAVPYVGWETALLKAPKAFSGAKKMMDAVNKVGDAVNSPISTGFKREILKWAPFEATRLGLSQVAGDNPLGEEVTNSILNLALAGGVGGLVGAVRSAGKRDPGLETIFPGINIAAPAALQARHMKALLDGGAVAPELVPKANLKLKEFNKEIRTQELTRDQKYVVDLDGDPAKVKGLEQQLNRWFRPTAQPGSKALQIRAFSNGADKNFGPGENWIDELDLAGVGGPRVVDPVDPNVVHHPDPPWPYGQYFRSISFHPTGAAQMPKVVDNRITKGFENIGDNWFMAREADDGMFVMAKKYSGVPGKAAPTDKWLMFKTDQPGRYAPENQVWADAMVGLQKWHPVNAAVKDGGLVYNTLAGLEKEMPFRNYQAISNPTVMEQAIAKLGPVGESEVAQQVKETFRELFTPRGYQFTKIPRANHIAQASKLVYDRAMNIVNELMNGTIVIQPGKQLFYGFLSGKQGALGLPPLRDLKPNAEEWTNVFDNYIRKNVPIEKAELAYKAGDLSEGGFNILKSLQAVNDVTTSNTNLAEIAAGIKPTEWKAGHYGWSHVWEGDTRVPLFNEKGQHVFTAGGPNKRAAQKAAEQAQLENPTWKLGQAYSKIDVSTGAAAKVGKQEADDTIRSIVLSPSFILERAGVGGYKWHNKTPTFDEFLQDIEGGLVQRYRYQANLSFNDIMMPQLERLKNENTAAYKQVVDRINADAGIQGKWGRAINRAVDEKLAPMIGNESASRIVGVTNTAMYNFYLGAMNLSYPAVSLLSFIQTTLPETAFVLGALPERLSPYYSFALAGGSVGPKGAMAFLQPLRLAGRALMEMKNPGAGVADAVAWGLNNRTLDPRNIEEYVGAASTKVKDIYKLGKGEIKPKEFNFGSWLRALSEWLPANSERMSRTHTFIMGYITARDLLRKGGQRLTEEQMRTFAQQFTNKTMYLYGAADRPKMLTSPVGSGLGLFKNWMFNYMAQMGQYSKEAFLKNHWSPLLWQTAGTFAVGGLAATPIVTAADQFSKLFGYEDSLSMVYDELGVDDAWFDPADGIMYGLPSMLSGVSFYSQAQAPGSNPSRDAAALFNSVIWDRLNASKTAIGGAIDHWSATGAHPGSDATVRLQMARAFLPSTFYRIMSVESDTIRSPTTGYPMVKDLSLYERTLYRLKLNPVDVDKAMAVSNRLYAKREEKRAAVATLGEAFTNAQMKGDSAEMAMVVRQAMVWGLDTSSVLKSAAVRMAKHREDMINRGYKPSDIALYQSVLGE
jgi:hypothetical protein